MNRKKEMLLGLIALFGLSGCGIWEREVVANVTGYSRMCIDGVEYLQFASGATVAWTTDGKIKMCKK